MNQVAKPPYSAKPTTNVWNLPASLLDLYLFIRFSLHFCKMYLVHEYKAERYSKFQTAPSNPGPSAIFNWGPEARKKYSRRNQVSGLQ